MSIVGGGGGGTNSVKSASIINPPSEAGSNSLRQRKSESNLKKSNFDEQEDLELKY